MKRKSFEEIVHEEFRWPMAGDAPFVEADDIDENANIVESPRTRLVFMMEGYRRAADLMIDRANEDPVDRAYLVCPIIFNYRQFLELSLKYMLVTYGRPVGVKPNWNSHDLEILWREFALLLEGYGTPDPDQADPIVADVVAQFAKIDPASYSYRYPVDRKGQPVPLSLSDLHLPTLKTVMEAVANYFTGCDGYLDNLIANAP